MAAEDLDRTIEELNASMQALVAAINPAVAAQLEKTKADREAAAEVKKATKEAEAERKKAADKEKKEEEEKQEKVKKLAVEGATQLARVFTSAAGAMYKGEKGMSAFNGSVDAAAGSLVALVGVVTLLTGGGNLLAAGLAAAVTGVAAYVKATAEQSDKLYDAFQDMSRAGAAGADGLQGVYNDMQKFGLGIQDLGKMSELLKSNSQNLALFGGTVFQGRKKFADVSQAMEPFRASLMNAGMNQDEINEGTAGYIRLQTNLGRSQNRNNEELAESTRKFLLEQEALTKVTGLNRKEQEDVRNKALARERFAGKILELQQKGDKQSLEAADKLFEFMTMIEGSGLEAGMADLSTALGAGSADAIKAFNATAGEGQGIMQRLTSNQISAAEAADQLKAAMGRQMSSSDAATRAQMGVYSQISGDLAPQMRFLGRGANGFTKSLGEAKTQLEGQGATGKKAHDAELDRQTQMRLTQQKAMMNMQDFVRYGVDPATKAMSWFGEVVETITGMLPFAGDARKESEERMAFEKNKRAAEEQNQIIIEAMARQKKAANKEEMEAAKLAEKNAREKRKLLDEERQELIKTSQYFKDKGPTRGPTTITGAAPIMGAPGSSGALAGKTSGLNPRLASALEQAAAEYKTQTGKTISVNSGVRTTEEQQSLYDRWVAAGGGPNKPTAGGITTPARAGSSLHERGLAVDINQADAEALDKMGLLAKYGLSRPHDKDPIHIQLAQFEAGGMLDGIGIVGEKGPELAVGQASITSNNDIMGAFRAMNAELSAHSMLLAEIARATKSSSTSNEKMLRTAMN